MSAPDGPPPARRPAGTSTVSWIAGVAVVVLLAVVTLNTLRTQSAGSRGVPAGRPLPPFAVPLATADVPAGTDANVATRPREGALGSRPACEVRGPQILNSCQLAERGPVVLAFTATRSGRCQDQVDVLERVRARHPEVGFAAVAVKGSRNDVREEIRRRGWRLPVGYDHDGAVANEYAVAVCPTITFARRGGRVAGTSLELLDAAAVERWIARLER